MLTMRAGLDQCDARDARRVLDQRARCQRERPLHWKLGRETAALTNNNEAAAGDRCTGSWGGRPPH
jgi:hypothetical protein